MTHRRSQQPEPAAVGRDGRDNGDLQLRLSVHGEFTDVLHDLMQACDDPPSDARLLELLERSLESVVDVTDSELGAFMLREDSDRELVLVLQHQPTAPGRSPGPASGLSQWQSIPEGEGVAHWVARHKRSAVVNSPDNDPRCGPEIGVDRKVRIRSAIAVPVVNGGHVLGVVEVINKRHGALYAMRDRKRLELICHFNGKLLAELVNRSQVRRERTVGEGDES